MEESEIHLCVAIAEYEMTASKPKHDGKFYNLLILIQIRYALKFYLESDESTIQASKLLVNNNELEIAHTAYLFALICSLFEIRV